MLTTRKVNAPVPAYTRTAIAAHWLLGVLILGQISIGFYVADLPISIERLIWVSRHKALGVTILVLMLLRLGWRLTHSPGPYFRELPAWQSWLSRSVHWLLYILVVAVATSGWLFASASGLTVNWFGFFLVPDLIDKSKEWASVFKLIHSGAATTLGAALTIHISAALWHGFIKRDGVLKRMWFNTGSKT